MSALMLRVIACFAMLLDHIGYAEGIPQLRFIGRIAFPIFVYLIYNGYKHTKSPAKYALRLGLFALISQVPFSLLCGYPTFWYRGNVFITLLMALLCVWSADVLAKRPVTKWACLLPALAVVGGYYFGLLKSDYGAKGIIMVMVFWLLDGKAIWKRMLTCVLVLCAVYYSEILGCALNLVRGNGFIFTLTDWGKTQVWSLLALPLIFAYNGQKGKMPGGKIGAKIAQYGFYIFYPAHMLILWFITK